MLQFALGLQLLGAFWNFMLDSPPAFLLCWDTWGETLELALCLVRCDAQERNFSERFDELGVWELH